MRTDPRLQREDPEVSAAIRFGLVTAVLGVLFLTVAAVVASGCDGAVVDSVTCGRPQRIVLALGAPVILFGGGVRAFVRTYQTWKHRQTW